jgi:hypothetical protein
MNAMAEIVRAGGKRIKDTITKKSERWRCSRVPFAARNYQRPRSTYFPQTCFND